MDDPRSTTRGIRRPSPSDVVRFAPLFVLLASACSSTATFGRPIETQDAGDDSGDVVSDLALAPAFEPAAAAPPDAVVDLRSFADLADFGRFPEISKEDRSWVIPAAEILTFEFALNQYDRHVVDSETYGSDWSTFRDNLHRGWIIDHDPFATNQVFHPYAGSIYFGFARSAGLNFWQSFVYTFLGSALWELGGETGRPSLNDQVTTGISGTFLGESMFRIAGWILNGEDGEPGFYHEFASAIASPPTWVNRHAFGSRFQEPFAADVPAVEARLSLAGRNNLHVIQGGLDRNLQRDELVGSFEIDYGLPGKPGYQYDDPFDYFHFDFDVTSSGESTMENVDARGLLYGTRYGEGSYRGIWGLFGDYSYVSPEIFRVSTTALTFGTVGQWWLSEKIALQETAFVGVGYGASGTIAENEVDRDYHYGGIPEGLVGCRLIFGSLATLEFLARDFYVSGIASDRTRGHENVAVAEAALTFQIFDRQTIGIQCDYARRDAAFTSLVSRRQTIETASLVYTYVFGNTHSKLGAVEWREGHGQ